MAETFINARDIVVSLDLVGNGSYQVVACLTENGLPTSRPPIDTTSKCGQGMQPGDQVEQTVTGSGIAINQTGQPTKESYSAIYTLLANKTIVWCMFGPAQPIAGDTFYEGQVTVTELNITATDKDVVKFDFVFTPVTPPLVQTTY